MFSLSTFLCALLFDRLMVKRLKLSIIKMLFWTFFIFWTQSKLIIKIHLIISSLIKTRFQILIPILYWFFNLEKCKNYTESPFKEFSLKLAQTSSKVSLFQTWLHYCKLKIFNFHKLTKIYSTNSPVNNSKTLSEIHAQSTNHNKPQLKSSKTLKPSEPPWPSRKKKYASDVHS